MSQSKFLYYKVKEEIQLSIETGVLKPGTKMPTEEELQKRYDVSRQTIRKALKTLLDEGYIERKRGSGTWVTLPKISSNANFFSTFSEDIGKYGISHSAKVISASQHPTPSELRNYIDESSEVFEIVRLRLAGYTPLVVRKSFIPINIYPDLLNEDLEKEPLYDILRNKAGVVPYNATQKFRAVNAAQPESALLDIDEGAAIFVWEGLVFDTENQLIEGVVAYYRGDSFEFSIDQTKGWASSDTINIPNEWFNSNV